MSPLAVATPRRARVIDSFDRADSALSLGTADTLQAWTAHLGTWGITGGRAYNVSGTSNGRATLDAGTVDLTAEMEITGANLAGFAPMLIFRAIDANNFLAAGLFNGSVILYSYEGGFTVVASAAQTTTDGVTYTVRVVASGTPVRISVDGVEKINHTLTGSVATKFTGQAATRVGMRSNATGDRFNNLRVRL